MLGRTVPDDQQHPFELRAQGLEELRDLRALDDDPRNGPALTPNMHWAMDRNLIAPGPDLKWHVSAVLDDRVPDLAMPVNLEGKALILPTQARFAPKREALEWRIENLRR